MTDVHAHLLPGVDDGAQTLTQSIEMVRLAKKEGIDHIICTPHIHKEFDLVIQKVHAQYDLLWAELDRQGVTMQLSIGYEVFASNYLLNYESVQNLTLGSGKWLLLELDFQQVPEELDEILYYIGLYGITVILAHPERYEYLYKKLDWLKELKAKGVQLQVNAGSITGLQGRKAQKMAMLLVKAQLADYIGTDMHSARTRGPYIRQALAEIEKRTSIQYVKQLQENASRLGNL